MEQRTKIPIPVFNYTIFVIFTDDLKTTGDNLVKEGKLRQNTVDDATEGFTVRMPNQSYTIIVLKINAPIEHMTHEVYHAISNMFDWIGAKHEEEIFAYFTGYINRLVSIDQNKAQKKLDKGKDL
jgi:hypothetical protein